MTKIQRQIKDRILSQRGITRTLPKKGSGGDFMPRVPITNNKKTPLMRLLEVKYGKGRTIEDILLSGSLSEVRKLLGKEVNVTTLSKWIKRFKLRYTPTNLPQCVGCPHYKPSCDYGVCPYLMKLEEWDLVQEKRKEILNGKD